VRQYFLYFRDVQYHGAPVSRTHLRPPVFSGKPTIICEAPAT
jgi:hypothetical protein